MAAMEDGGVGTVVGGSGNRNTTSAGSSGSTTTSPTHDLGSIDFKAEDKILENLQAYGEVRDRLLDVLDQASLFPKKVKTHLKKVLEDHGSSSRQLNLVLNVFKEFLFITLTLQGKHQPLEKIDDKIFMDFWASVISSSDEKWFRFLKDNGGKVGLKEVIPKDVFSDFGFVAAANKEKVSLPGRRLASQLQSFEENLSWIEENRLQHKKHVLPFLQALSSCFPDGESWMDSTAFEKILVKHHSFEELKLLLEIVWKTIFEGNGSKSFTRFFQSISIKAGESSDTFLGRLESSFQTSELGLSSNHHQASTSTTSLPILEGQQSSGVDVQEARRFDAHPEGEERDDWNSNDVVGDLQLAKKKVLKGQEEVGNDSKRELGGREGKSSTLTSTSVSLESNSTSRNQESIEGPRAPSHSSSDSRIDHESSPTSTSRATGGERETSVERSPKLEGTGRGGDGGDKQASRAETKDESKDGNATVEAPNVTSSASTNATSTQVALQPTEKPVLQTPLKSTTREKRPFEAGSSGEKRKDKDEKNAKPSFSSPASNQEADSSVCRRFVPTGQVGKIHHRQETGQGMDYQQNDQDSSRIYDSSFDGAPIPTRGHHLGSVDSTVAASSQPQEAHRDVPASYSEVLSSNANASLSDAGSTGPILAIDGASSSSRTEEEERKRVALTTSNPSASASSNGNASSTPTSGSIPHQGQQPIEGPTDKASPKSNDSAKGAPFTTSHSSSDEKNLPSLPPTNSGIEGRPKAVEDDGDSRPGLDSTSQARTLTIDQNATTESLSTPAAQPARAETESPSLSPSNSISGVGMTTSTTHSSFNTSGSTSRFDFGPALDSTSSLASMASQDSLIEGEGEKEGETKAPIVDPSPTSSGTEGGVEGKVGKVGKYEGFEDGKKSDSKVEDSEEVKRENVSGGTAKSSNASSNLSEHAKKEISTGSASLDQGGKGIESSPTESSARTTGSNSFEPSSQASSSKRQASNQPLSDVENSPVTASAPPASPSYSASDYQNHPEYQALVSSPSTTSISQEGLLLQYFGALKDCVVPDVDDVIEEWDGIYNLGKLIQADFYQALSDAKKDLEDMNLHILTLSLSSYVPPFEVEEAYAPSNKLGNLKRIDPQVRGALVDQLKVIHSEVVDLTNHEASLEGDFLKVAQNLRGRTLGVLGRHIKALGGVL